MAIGSLVTAFVLAGAASASAAATRYAAPGGTADDLVCTTPAAAKCSINEAAAGNNVNFADEVVITPGNYSDTAGDLGASGYVTLVAANVHGESGLPRPLITKNTSSGFGAFYVANGRTLSDVEIDSAVSTSAVSIENGTLQRVIARSSANGAVVCTHLIGGTLRDTACLATGDGATALGANSGIGFVDNHTVTLRNVTARATGSNSYGMSYFVSAAGGTYTVDAKSVIARGTSADVRASESGGLETAINLDYSNYATATPSNGATVTAAGTLNNQTAAPMLAADGYHQVPGSPTTDAGTTDGSSGTSDIDGHPRTIGPATDIGADEVSTTTVVACTPTSVVLGAGSSTCTATVTDGNGVPSAPTGNVSFSSNGAGTFSGGGSCALAGATSPSSCQVTYTPTGVGTGTHQITGTYAGDPTHEASQGLTSVTVTLQPTATAIGCTPSSLLLGSGGTTCTATVTDTSANPTAPTGSVSFSAAGGSFSGGGSCVLAPAVNPSTCQVTYTPATAGANLINGSYGGDAAHTASQGAAALTVFAPPSPAPPSATPSTGTAKKCKKGRKLVKRKGKLRCVKKKRKK